MNMVAERVISLRSRDYMAGMDSGGWEKTLREGREMYAELSDLYKPEDITVEKFSGVESPDESIRAIHIRHLQRILLFHPDAIARHEASFIARHYQIDKMVAKMMIVASHGDSIVEVHEVLEALGEMHGQRHPAFTVRQIARFLENYAEKNSNPLRTHPDIVATLIRARRQNAALISKFPELKQS